MIWSVIAGLGCFVVVVVVAQAYVWLRRLEQRRYPVGVSYASFTARPPEGVGVGLFRRLPCEGRCDVTRWHEDDGDGNTTCIACGTPRPTATDGA